MITLDSVDLPEPLGPISAWTSPWRTVRSIPRKIFLPSTVACSPRTSRVAGVAFVISSSHLDPHVVVGHGHGERRDRLDRRQPHRLAGVQVEQRPVLRALDRALVRVDLSLVEEEVLVRADRVDGAEAVLAEVDHGDRSALDGEPAGLAGRDVLRRTHLLVAHQIALRSSSWIASSAPVRTSSRATRSSTSWKNPVTTRRSASSRGIPRLCR